MEKECNLFFFRFWREYFLMKLVSGTARILNGKMKKLSLKGMIKFQNGFEILFEIVWSVQKSIKLFGNKMSKVF